MPSDICNPNEINNFLWSPSRKYNLHHFSYLPASSAVIKETILQFKSSTVLSMTYRHSIGSHVSSWELGNSL